MGCTESQEETPPENEKEEDKKTKKVKSFKSYLVMPDDVKQAFTEIFQKIDANGSGSIDAAELGKVVTEKAEARRVFREHDLDKNKIVTLDEWLAFFDKLHHSGEGEDYYGKHGLIEDARYVYHMPKAAKAEAAAAAEDSNSKRV